ncbi:MAG: hypothetical protein JW706_08295 [Opitutales bacterium]|nr:hypothetical protein [Opitutales bacterium]
MRSRIWNAVVSYCIASMVYALFLILVLLDPEEAAYKPDRWLLVAVVISPILFPLHLSMMVGYSFHAWGGEDAIGFQEGIGLILFVAAFVWVYRWMGRRTEKADE